MQGNRWEENAKHPHPFCNIALFTAGLYPLQSLCSIQLPFLIISFNVLLHSVTLCKGY